MFILSLILLPVRIITVGFTFLCALWLAKFIISDASLDTCKPQSNFKRRLLLPVLKIIARTVYFFGGIFYVNVKGVRASRTDAPILVLGPHSSFLDTLAVVIMGLPSCVATVYHACSPVGGLIKVLQPILVRRDDPGSRRNTLDEITARVTSPDNWPQLVIFPEGTCANRNFLIPFRQGAFRPGVPVQPVLLRYPNNVDTASWVSEGPSVWTLLWMTFTQFMTRMEIEFLPVYKPSEQERSNPQLYANNVRRLMAEALGIPACDLIYDDFCRMRVASESHLPDPEGIVCLHGLLQIVFESQYDRQKGYRDWAVLRLEALLTSARRHKFLSEDDFISNLILDTKLDDRGKLLLYLAIRHYTTDLLSGINFRRFCTRACILLYASDPLNALRLAFKAFEWLDASDLQTCPPAYSESRNMPVPMISEKDAAELLSSLFNLELSAVITDMQPIADKIGTYEQQMPWTVKDGFSADELFEALSFRAPTLLACFGKYESKLLDSLGRRRGRPLLDLCHGNYQLPHYSEDQSSLSDCVSDATPSLCKHVPIDLPVSNGAHPEKVKKDL